ncbi:FAD:protein FMN transferase [Streptomyces sp. L7]
MTTTTLRRTAAADWRALGTSVRLVVTDPALLDSCNLLLARHLAEVDAACSRFRPDSELAALDASSGRPVTVSPLLAEALAVALRAAEATDGAVDPTVGSAMNAIGYDRDFTLVREDDRPVRLTVKRAPGWRLIDLDRTTGTVTVPAGVRLDLGATAKAWAADKAAAMLAEVAGCGVLVSLGGDTAVAGSPGRRLEHPRPGRHRFRRRDAHGRHVRHDRPALRRPRHLGHGSPQLAPQRPRTAPHRRPAHRPPRPQPLAHGLGRRGDERRRQRGDHGGHGQGRGRRTLAHPPRPPRPPGRTGRHGRHDPGLAHLHGGRRVSSEILWYANRATGAVCLVLFTVVVLLGIAVRLRTRLPGLPRFGTVTLHRSLSLSATAFLALHIAVAVIDGYVSISALDAFVPFISSYQPLWLGLGTVAFDLMLAVLITSLLRERIGHRTWRALHWLAYASWPVALIHGIGIGTDTGTDWMTWLTVSCVAAVVAAFAIRTAHSARAARRTPAALLRTAEGARS